MTKAKLTKKQKKLLKLLYADATLEPADLADDLFVSTEEVREEIAELRDQKYINQPIAIVDPARIGYRLTTYHFLSSSLNFDEALKEQIYRFPDWSGTQLAAVVLGDFDVVFRKLSKDEGELDRFATNVLSEPSMTSPEVQSLETYQVTQRVRWRGMELPQQSHRSPPVYDLTETEEQVLHHLQADGKLRENMDKLATEVGVDEESARKIVETFESNNIILGYSYPVNYQKLGWYRALFGLSIKHGSYHSAISAIQEEDPLNVPHISSGLGFSWADILVELVFEDITELDIMTDRLWGLEPVNSTRTYFSTRTFYHDESVQVVRRLNDV